MLDTVLKRAGLGVLLAGIVLFVATSVLNRRAVWLPLAENLPLAAHQTVSFDFTAARDGWYELQVEADDRIGDDACERFLTATNRPSELDLTWTVARDGETLVAGGSRDYVYVEQGPPSLLGRLRRILLRIPYCQNERQWRTVGILGSSTSARGIGRFQAAAGSRYAIQVTPAADYPTLERGDVRLVVRPDRRLWNDHFTSTRTLGYAALLALGAGTGMLLLGRFATPRAANR